MEKKTDSSPEKPSGFYPEVQANPDFPAIEESVLRYWQEEKLFEKSVECRPAHKNGQNNEFIFYDGPPFANGLPHYGHLLTGFVKDLYARYQTMKGKRVERRFGWDCHGLPAEMGSEKELGISGRQAIMQFGIGKFNEHCRTSVMKYTSEWEHYVTRQARWVDFKGDYKTMDVNFMESVIWAFKEIYKKGWVYEAYRVMPYSWAAETPLSNFETKLDNSYREREDKAATVAFELRGVPKVILDSAQVLQTALLETSENVIKGLPNENSQKEYRDFIESIKQPLKTVKILAWTTTPWTLPSNLALAVSTDMNYLAIPVDGIIHVLAYRATNSYKKELKLPSTMILGHTGGNVEESDAQESLKAFFIAMSRNEKNITIPEKYSIKGADLIGLTYEPLFPYFKKGKTAARDAENAFRILDGSSFVTDGDGTGIVHMAPGFGEDDFQLCKKNDIGYYEPMFDAIQDFDSQNSIDSPKQFVCPVDGQGKYTNEIFDLPDLSLKGLNVIADTRLDASDKAQHIGEKDVQKFGTANMRILRWLKAHNKLIKDEVIKHNYPHCWRTDTPLIYRAMPSWYVEVTKFRDRAVELNQQINWIPAHIRDGQMGHMLATAPDWSISRNRFWGTPIPVWRSPSGKIIVCGSIAEIEKLSGQKVEDLHRPYIDNITFEKDGETYKRVEDVFDCWFESGSMPFAQVHYPFENKQWFEEHFPADFITEYVGQTRGWFNTLIMLSTALFDKPPFKNCICHGVVLDAETGLKYSKRLKNYKDPLEVINQFGADALRWLMIASPVMRGQDLMVDPQGKFIRDVVRLAIKPIWNAYNFFTLYANADGIKAKFDTSSQDVMDRYILAKCKQAVEVIEKSLDSYDTPAACDALQQFFDALNNWYIRRNKERFWKEEKDADKQAAYDTLYTVLHVMCRAAAPLLPLTLEDIYRGLTGGESVHLADFPDAKAVDIVPETISAVHSKNMDLTRDICNAGLGIRNKVNIRVRQPLASLTLVAKFNIKDVPELAVLVEDEVNIKSITCDDNLEAYATLKLAINNPVLGKRVPEKMKQIIPASKKGEWKQIDGTVEICGERLQPGEYTLQLEPKPEYKDRAQALSTNDALVILDTTITPELEMEGIARDLVRLIQQARKDADLHVSDRIMLGIVAPEQVTKALTSHEAYIKEQTLAVTVSNQPIDKAYFTTEAQLENDKVVIFLSNAA